MGYQNFYADKLYADIGAADTTITVNTPPTVTSGRMVLEARNTSQREIISYSGVSGNQLTGVTRGIGGTTAKAHTKNALIEMNVTAQDLQDIIDAFGSFAATNNDWRNAVSTFSFNANNGQKETVLNSSADLTAILTPGSRMKFTRGTVPPTQCMSFQKASSQYASKTSPAGISFTTAFTVEAWVYLNSYPATGADGAILSRYSNGTGGFGLAMQPSGQLRLFYQQSGGQISGIDSFQSIPLNRWVHLSANVSNTATGAGTIYMNGVAIPSYRSFTAATTLTQAGNLQIGAEASLYYHDGQIAEARLWSVAQTQAQVLANMAINLTGAESNLVGLWRGAGNFNDLTANANNLTASGGAIATYADNPYKPIEYAIVTKVTSTLVTVFTGTDHNIPNMTLSSPQYTGVRAPFGFPNDRSRWWVDSLMIYGSGQTLGTNVWVNLNNSFILQVPTGNWHLYHSGTYRLTGNGTAVPEFGTGIGASATTAIPETVREHYATAAGAASLNTQTSDTNVNNAAMTPYYINMIAFGGGGTLTGQYGNGNSNGYGNAVFRAECPYF